MSTATEEITEEVEVDPEVEKVAAWRKTFFTEVLGPKATEKQIQALVESEASPHDALKLRNMECPNKLIVRILA